MTAWLACYAAADRRPCTVADTERDMAAALLLLGIAQPAWAAAAAE